MRASRCEFFIFSCWSEMLGQEKVELWAASNDGELTQYPKVEYTDA